MLLAHPEAEDLGRFVEGTLDDSERTAIVQHIADCDDCRVLVVDAAEFTEPAKVERHSNWWMGVAASLVLVAAIGTVTYHQLRDPLAHVKEMYAKVPNRPLEARLSGFAYVQRQNMRGSAEEVRDVNKLLLDDAAGEVMQTTGDDAKTRHARGIANLVVGNRRDAIVELTSAVMKDTGNAHYWSDLAAAELAQGDAKRALAATDRALALDESLPEALFNRALALQQLDDSARALATYRAYLVRDSTSKWADEAKRRIENLQLAP